MFNKILDAEAKKRGYYDRFDLLRDYGIFPTVLTPHHKKIELISVIIKGIKKTK